MIEKCSVHDIAKELGISSKEVIVQGNMIGIQLSTAYNEISTEVAEILINYIITGTKPVQPYLFDPVANKYEVESNLNIVKGRDERPEDKTKLTSELKVQEAPKRQELKIVNKVEPISVEEVKESINFENNHQVKEEDMKENNIEIDLDAKKKQLELYHQKIHIFF